LTFTFGKLQAPTVGPGIPSRTSELDYTVTFTARYDLTNTEEALVTTNDSTV
jgi:hypothetical protein